MSSLLFLLQAVETVAAPSGLREFISYVSQAAAMGAFVFAWRTNTRVTRLETILTEPDMGVVPKMSEMRQASHKVNGDLHEHGIRLDGHDREIGEIKEDRRHDVRRKEDRQ